MIASEQLWPNLLGLQALRERDGGIASLTILHTDDRDRSIRPAEQLADVASQMFPAIEPRLQQVGSSSQEVFAAIWSRVNGLHLDRLWTINCSGGTKAMFAGLIPLLRHLRVQGFYREVSGRWFHLRPDSADQFQAVVCEPWHDASSVRLDLPVRSLATRQFGQNASTGWSHAEPPQLDMLSVVQTGRRENWNWEKLRRSFPNLSQLNNGWAFEDFFGALVRCLGAPNTIVRLTRSEGMSTVAEFDVLVSTGHKLVIFDLKLTGEDDSRSERPNTQLSRLAQDRRLLGGLGAVAVAVRPTWARKSSVEAMARGHQVTLWTQNDLPALFPALRNLLDLPPAAPGSVVEEVEKEYQKAVRNRERLLAGPLLPMPGSKTPDGTTRTEPMIGWLNSGMYFTDCASLGCRWRVIDLQNMFVVSMSHAKGRDGIRILRDEIGPLVDWKNSPIVASKSGTSVKAALLPAQSVLPQQLQNRLRELVRAR
jgi:hypothetical protein